MTKNKNDIGFLRSMASALISRAALSAKLGVQMDGNRDLYAVFGWKTQPGYDDFFRKYLRQGIARRVVDAPASATWRNPPTVKGPTESWNTAWNNIVREHELWGTIDRADRLAGIGQYSVLLLGIDDSSKLERPVSTNRENKLLYVQPYSEAYAKISEYVQDPTDARFGLPSKYRITVADPQATSLSPGTIQGVKMGSEGKEYEVHYSRIVHIAEGLIDNNFLGTPRLLPVYNDLDDLLKVAGGTAETFWLGSNRGMQFDIDKDADISPEDAADLADEIEEWQNQLRRAIKTRGVKVNPLGGDVPDPKNTFDMIVSQISGATGIPKRVLTGSEVGQLASDQDRANWSDRIKERRTTFAQPMVLLPLIERLVGAKILPEAPKDSYEFEWPSNFQLTPLENAQTMAQQARAIVNIAKHYKEAPLVSKAEARTILGLPEELPEGIEEFDPETEGPNAIDPNKQLPEDDLGEDDPDEVPEKSEKPSKSNNPQEND